MTKAQRMRELVAENVALKYELEKIKETIKHMQENSKKTIGMEMFRE